MKRYLIPFFATPSDLEFILNHVARLIPLDFVRRGSFEASDVRYAHPPFDMDQNDSYLILAKGKKVIMEEVPQRRGGTRYVVDQSQNPDSINLKTGGFHDPNVLLPGQLGTISASSESLNLFKAFEKAIHNHFEKLKSYYIGTEALNFLDRGGRLTASAKGSSQYDLRRL